MKSALNGHGWDHDILCIEQASTSNNVALDTTFLYPFLSHVSYNISS